MKHGVRARNPADSSTQVGAAADLVRAAARLRHSLVAALVCACLLAIMPLLDQTTWALVAAAATMGAAWVYSSARLFGRSLGCRAHWQIVGGLSVATLYGSSIFLPYLLLQVSSTTWATLFLLPAPPALNSSRLDFVAVFFGWTVAATIAWVLARFVLNRISLPGWPVSARRWTLTRLAAAPLLLGISFLSIWIRSWLQLRTGTPRPPTGLAFDITTVAWSLSPLTIPACLGWYWVEIAVIERRLARLAADQCGRCGYSRTGLATDTSCPECGHQP